MVEEEGGFGFGTKHLQGILGNLIERDVLVEICNCTILQDEMVDAYLLPTGLMIWR